MFTGIITHQAVIKSSNSNSFAIANCFESVELGESIAINGVCLTVTTYDDLEIFFDISPETLSCTNLGLLNINDIVNTEKSLKVGASLGGHFVLGHVDKTAIVTKIEKKDDFKLVIFSGFSTPDMAYLLKKGCVTINGVSLTINEVFQQTIECMLVPHTIKNTNLNHLKVNDRLNVEFDYLARIIVHQTANNDEERYV